MNKYYAMHAAFAKAAEDMHYNDELLSEMLDAHAQLAAGNSVAVLDNLLDTLNAEFDNNEANSLMAGRDAAHAAIEALEEEDTHTAMMLLMQGCVERLHACEQAYG